MEVCERFMGLMTEFKSLTAKIGELEGSIKSHQTWVDHYMNRRDEAYRELGIAQAKLRQVEGKIKQVSVIFPDEH